MNLEIKKWNQSNVNVNFILDEETLEKYKVKSTKKIGKEIKIPGFREWHVPTEMIVKQVGEEYIRANAIEMYINDSLDQLLKDHQEKYKFIWDIYDLAIVPNTESEIINISYNVDSYPTISKSNDNWKKVKIETLNNEASKEEIDSSFINLMSQYWEWVNVEEITEKTSARAKAIFIDSNWLELETSRVFVNNNDMTESETLKSHFMWKKMNDEFEVKYNYEELPHSLHYHKDEQKPAKILLTIDAIQENVIPEINEENIKKFFWSEWISSEEELKEKISEVIKSEKWANNLTNSVEKYLWECEPSFECIIPKTMVEYEFETRIENMSKRFGSKEKMEKYLQVVNEKNMTRNIKEYYDEIRKSASQSISKFFLFKKITEELWIDSQIDWDKELDPENKLHNFLTK